MENEKQYFVIEQHKWSYPKDHFQYRIMKDKSFNLSDATKVLMAYEQLNDNEDIIFHLQPVDLMMSTPLVLTKEVA